MIKNIIFDLGGVLLNLDIKKTQDAFLILGIGNFKDMLGLGHASSFVLEHEIGKIPDEQFVAELKKLARRGTNDELLLNAWNAMLVGFSVDTIEFLKFLKSKYRLFLFSNTNAIHLKTINKLYQDAIGEGSLEDHFEKVYYSHVMGLRKPAKEAFELIIEENGLNPSETLFVDDAAVNLSGAKQAGLQTFHLESGRSIQSVVESL